MGATATFTGLPEPGGDGTLPVVSYSVTEAVTPLTAGDSSGQIGTFDVTVRTPDPHAPKPSRGPALTLWDDGPDVFVGATLHLEDTSEGGAKGVIVGTQSSDDGGTVTFSALLGPTALGAFNFSMPPNRFTTLEGLLHDFLNLIGIPNELVDLQVPVVYLSAPGWRGEVWHYLKQLLTAYALEAVLIEGVVTIRPARQSSTGLRGATAQSRQLQTQSLAQSVEVYQYNNTPLGSASPELAYPPGGWSSSVEVLNVNAGEEAEYTLELSSSLESIEAPTMVTSVSRHHDSSSVYSIVADDGLVVTPAAWEAHGGGLSVEIGEDFTTLTLRVRGASGLPTASGVAAQNFSIAMAADASGSRYSSLRIVGTGVRFDKQKVRIPTGVTETRTATDVGLTIDNPYLSDANQVFSAGTKAARQFAGPVFQLSGTLAPRPGLPVIGELAGSRVFDPQSRRWFRVRSASRSRGASFNAEDDVLWSDVQELLQGKTYDDVQSQWGRLTYAQWSRRGLRWP